MPRGKGSKGRKAGKVNKNKHHDDSDFEQDDDFSNTEAMAMHLQGGKKKRASRKSSKKGSKKVRKSSKRRSRKALRRSNSKKSSGSSKKGSKRRSKRKLSKAALRLSRSPGQNAYFDFLEYVKKGLNVEGGVKFKLGSYYKKKAEAANPGVVGEGIYKYARDIFDSDSKDNKNKLIEKFKNELANTPRKSRKSKASSE